MVEPLVNPFAGYGGMVRGQRLVGRDRDVLEFSSNLSHADGSYSVVGAPWIGKSSLVGEARRRLAELSPSLLPSISVSIQHLRNSADVFRQTRHEILCAICDRSEIAGRMLELRVDGGDDQYEAYRECAIALQTLRASDPKFRAVVVYEDFDYIRHLPGGIEAIRRLRALANSVDKLGLSCVFVSRRPLKLIEPQLEGLSSLAGICQPVVVRPLDGAALDAMVARANGLWSPTTEERRWLDELSGGLPYLAEMLLYHVCKHGAFALGVEAALPEAIEHCAALHQFLDDVGDFGDLVKLAVGPRWGVRMGAADRIRQYGLLRTEKLPSGDRHRARSDHLQAYLEKCSREAVMWEPWRETERALREAVDDILTEHEGAGWMDVLSSRHHTVQQALATARRRAQRERERLGASDPVTRLDYAYPAELWAIIAAEWERFESLLGKDRSYWEDRFKVIVLVRTPADGGRDASIPEAKLSLAQEYCLELHRRIK